MRNTEADWMAAMRHGDFAAAWAISDAVLAQRDPATRDDPTQPYHRRWVWDGRPFQGQDVLVRCYHGLGDTLQFLRYLPALRRLTAATTLEVQPALLPLLASYPGVDRLIPFQPAAPHQPAACDLEIMELAHALRLPPQSLKPPYLHVGPDQRYPGAIGLCWQAGGWDQARSIPTPLLAPLLKPALALVSLCPAPSGPAFRNPAGCPAAIEATAALMAGLRLVITVDTMVAHLAGALGLPTWLLLKYDADWRWGQGPAGSPWYPDMRVFRQDKPGDWRAVIAAVEQEGLLF
jgi:hypothetical protein